MISKNKIAYHIIIGLVFIVVPLLVTPPHRPEFGTKIGDYLIIRKEVTNLVLLLFFYCNYYWLLPVLYFKKKYIKFGVCLLLFMLLSLSPDWILNNFTSTHHNFTFIINTQITIFLFIAVFFVSYAIRISGQLKEAQLEIKNAQVSFLKGQINPHFLFNTLNSIYALAIKKSETTPTAIVKLSSMMRYSITEMEKEHVLLDKEIKFVNDYVDLQRMRLGDTCTILTTIENQFPSDKIIPLLFIPFIENAFKYGVATDENAVINLMLINNNGTIQFSITNKKLNHKPQENSTEIGITNTRKRLELLYPDKFQLDIVETITDFKIQLKIELR